jgi:lipoate---protein ligase
MKQLNLTLPSPEENLACDEALLDHLEENGGDEILRFWEPRRFFVVLGYARPLRTDVHVERCRPLDVPILRRCSGGGTVLQGPGCLNFSLLLKTDSRAPLRTITSSNQTILQRHAKALSGLLHRPVQKAGDTDLMIDGWKFSGNAQRRKRRWILFHGTFLLSLDLETMEYLLPVPDRQPFYRRRRRHRKFLRNLGVPAESIRNALAQAWSCRTRAPAVPLQKIQRLVQERYSLPAWTHRL